VADHRSRCNAVKPDLLAQRPVLTSDRRGIWLMRLLRRPKSQIAAKRGLGDRRELPKVSPHLGRANTANKWPGPARCGSLFLGETANGRERPTFCSWPSIYTDCTSIWIKCRGSALFLSSLPNPLPVTQLDLRRSLCGDSLAVALTSCRKQLGRGLRSGKGRKMSVSQVQMSGRLHPAMAGFERLPLTAVAQRTAAWMIGQIFPLCHPALH
jgi:hypothetical protein